MKLSHSDHGPVRIVALPPRLMMADAPAARSALQALTDQHHRRIALDLQAVEFIDSSGLSVLISTLKAARKRGAEVVLLEPSAQVLALIELTRLHEIFPIYADRQAAIEGV